MEASASLQSALERGGLARGYALRGEERYFRERAIELLRRAAEEKGLEVAFHDGERGNPDFELAHLIDDLSGGGLFGRRLVVVRHPAEHLKKVEGEDSPLTRALLAFLASDAGTVVLSDGTRLVRELQAGSSYLSSEDPRVHFGLGEAGSIRLVAVRYPDGAVKRVLRPRVDRMLTIRR